MMIKTFTPVREDLELVNTAKEKGWKIIKHRVDQYCKNYNECQFPLQFKKDNKIVWKVGNEWINEWIVADIDYNNVETYVNHRNYNTLREVFDNE